MIAFLFAFAMCILGAYGLHRFITGDVEPETSKKLLIGGSISAGLLLIFAFAPSALLSIWQSIMWTDMPETRQAIAQKNLGNLGQGALLAALFTGVLTIISYLRAQNKLQTQTFALVIIIIILVDTWRIDKLFLNYVDPNSVPPQEQVNTDAVTFLKQDKDLFRVLAMPNRNEMPLPEIDLVTGFNDFAIERYHKLMNEGAFQNPAILNLLNTKYIVAPQELNIGWLQKTAGRQGLHIYRNINAYPWFYLAPSHEIVSDANEIFKKLSDPTTNAIQTAFLEEIPGITSDTNATEPGTVKRLEYDERQGYIKLKTNASGSRILVVSQNHHANWTATVDGESKSLIRANYLWTAVALEPGEHIVELIYRDPIVATTRWISFAGVVILIASIVLSRRKPHGEPDNAE